MTFPIYKQITEVVPEEVVYEGGPIGSPMGGPIEGLTYRQQEVFKLLKENNKLSKRELAVHLKINVSAAQAHIDALRAKGYITRIGGTRGHWQFIKF